MRVYTVENKGTSTEYQKCIRAGDQKWETVEITIRTFFCLRFVFTSFYARSFQVPPEKNKNEKKTPPPKVPILTQNPDLT